MAVRRVARWQRSRQPSSAVGLIRACRRCGALTLDTNLIWVASIKVCEFCGKEMLKEWTNSVTEGAQCGGSSEPNTTR